MKRAIVSLTLVLLAALILTTASYAWFSMNRTVSATGMSVKAQTTSALVISSDRSDIGTSSTVNMNTAIATLIPCTHGDSSFPSGLKQLCFEALKEVDAGTGLKNTTDDFISSDYINAVKLGDTAINDSPNGGIPNYVDFTVYIAAKGAELDGQDIVVTISTDLTEAQMTDTFRAVSIDFYYQSTNGDGIGTYKGTLNLVGYDNVSNDQSVLTSFLISNVNIPFAEDYDETNYPDVTTGSSKITMRLYFDGGLKSTDEQCFINTNVSATSGISIGATFNAVAHSSS